MHIPVLCKEIIEVLGLTKGDFCIDGTLGGGGHARAILSRIMPGGRFLGCDRDIRAVENFRNTHFSGEKNILVCHANYATIPDILLRENLTRANAILLDLGFSSDQIEDSSRGMSFMHDAPLDMRYDTHEKTQTAKDILRTSSSHELSGIMKEFGEERYAEKIAQKIIEERKKYPIQSTFQLVKIIEMAVRGRRSRIHPATRVFQALRIAVNREWEYLNMFLENIPRMLMPYGKVAVISFHSSEDRIVKRSFAHYEKEKRGECIVRKPIIPSQKERRENPRSRSAKLRVLEYRGK